MDPLSIIGGVSAVGGIAAAIAKTVKNLCDARGRFEGADLTIHSLICELTTVEIAVTQIHNWARDQHASSPSQRDVARGFRTSLEGCRLAIDVMAKEVALLVTNNPFWRSAKVVWNEASMKDHQRHLQSQVAALQLLLQAARCQTEMQQASVLQSPKNREIIQKAVDDTSTLRASVTKSQRGPSTIVSHPESTNASLELDIDKEILITGPYRVALAHNVSEGRVEKLDRSASDSKNPFQRGPLQVETLAPMNVTGDSRYYDIDADTANPGAYRKTVAGGKPRPASESLPRSISDSASHADKRRNREPLKNSKRPEEAYQLTPMERFENDTRGKPWPVRRSISPDPHPRETVSSGHQQFPGPRKVSTSDPVPLRQFHFNNQKASPELKKSFWGTLTRRAGRPNVNALRTQTLTSSSTDMLRLTTGIRRAKRKHELNTHTSIDFGSPGGFSTPTIVRAAQSRSHIQISKLLEQRADIEDRHAQSGRTALAVAAHCGHDEIVALLLRHGAQINVLDSSNMTPLHLAASRNHFNVVQLLLENHANVDAIGPNGKTALRLAADSGHQTVVELLLQDRAKVNSRDFDNSTALHAAAKIGDDVIAKILIANGADFEARDGELMTPIHYAAENDHDHVTDVLLSHRADIEAPGKYGMSPLSVACRAGSEQVAKLLVARKANCRHESHGNMTPLHWAASGGHDEIGELLIQQKRVNIDAKSEEGRTPLHLAVLEGSFAATELLIRRGAAIEAECLESLRPLHYACRNADPALVRLLIASGADVEAPSKHRRPIHEATLAAAVSTAAIHVLSLLLGASATLEARDPLGERALTIAAMHGHRDVVKWLIQNRAAVSLPMPPKSNRPLVYDSPICKAAKGGHLAVVQELVNHGASIHSPDASNCQPLRYAAYHGHASTVRYLLSEGASLAILGLEPGSLEAGVGVMASLGFGGFHQSVPKEQQDEVLAIIREETEARERERKEELSLERMQERVQEQMTANMAGQRVGVDDTFYIPRASELSAVNYGRI